MRRVIFVAAAVLAAVLCARAAEWGGKVESSWLDTVKYDPATQVLRVQMQHSSDLYEYYGVPETVAMELLSAESVGTYYAQKIRGVYEMKLVTD